MAAESVGRAERRRCGDDVTPWPPPSRGAWPSWGTEDPRGGEEGGRSLVGRERLTATLERWRVVSHTLSKCMVDLRPRGGESIGRIDS